MSDYFSNFDNPYAAMAQGAYPDAPVRFPINAIGDESQAALKSGNSVKYDFSNTKIYKVITYPGGKCIIQVTPL